jgi:2-oxoglutarate dehydrogenase E1 component
MPTAAPIKPVSKTSRTSVTQATSAPVSKTPPQATQQTTAEAAREATFDVFRRWGYLQASLDPLGQYLAPEPFPVPVADGPDAELARGFYCGTIGAEFMHIASPEKRAWIQQRLECAYTAPDQKRILSRLIDADVFEQVIQQRYLGTKRFSLEGLTALIPYLDQTFNTAADLGVTRTILGMAHRGRLNVMTNTIGRTPEEIFTKFEDVDPRSTLGGGDVKYHMGATGLHITPNGKQVQLHLASNPSHLEAVDPVCMGRTRARQDRLEAEHPQADARHEILPILLHGDAAFAGQGIWAETLNFASIEGYEVGGTLQIITNNLLGFTALPSESNSSRFASDLAKRLPIPIFHVNAEDPDAVVRIAALAVEYRAQFGSDVVVDLIGYRRHGHSEVDDPTVTSPLRYAIIKDHPTLSELYAKKLGIDTKAEVQATQQRFFEGHSKAKEAEHPPHLHELPKYWEKYAGGPLAADDNPETGLPAEEVATLARAIATAPEAFHVHPKVQKLMDQRIEMGEGKRPFDYGAAELVAYASLLKAGTPVRLTGQDTQRGTFNQRHSVLVDIENEERFSPLAKISENQARWQVYNSMLSEAGCLGYEYGYSRDYPETLVLWEAQFGDFANGAQIIIDQFLAAGEAKWHLLSGVVLLLPHGYEGQGPEHSSARMERYLQLAAQDNLVVAQPSTAAQYFHLLRRQAMRRWRKPLIVFTPKSMLRHPDAVSPASELTLPHFQNVLPDTTVTHPRRLLVCSGKIGHNLRVERAKRGITDVGIIFVEQLYPFPEAELQAALDMHPGAHDILWVQEEPANMGANSYMMPLLRKLAGDRSYTSVKRTASASPATGSAKAHELEEKTLLDVALGTH